VVEHVGDVAYKLKLSLGAHLHDVFHVGLLKKFCGDPPAALPPIHHGRACLEPAEVVKARLARGRQELLVCWSGLAAVESSWADQVEFQQLSPSFQLGGELCLQGGEM
jgi:hypothetical protein